jgi:pyruvyl transferase EpsO
MKDHRSLMLDLQNTHLVILPLLEGRSFHYLDIPMHDNVGDLLIMQGTLRFFEKHKLKPKTISSAPSFKPEWVAPNDVLVFHGGGNFGDLYANINAMREEIIEQFPNNRIVILPQTIFFSTKEKEAASAAVFRRHRDVHLFIRDRVSQQIAGRFTDNVYLTPDMAHQLYPIAYDKVPTRGNLRIQRIDLEKRATPKSLQHIPIEKTTDWVEVIGDDKRWIDLTWKLEWRFNRYKWHGMLKLLGPYMWIPIAQRFSNRAVKVFAGYERIVTDRLHGHILSCLMDKPNTVIDNSYGKNSTYMNEWTIQSELVTLTGEDACA